MSAVITALPLSSEPKTHWEGPRERLARFGPADISETELVAVLLGTGTEGEPVMALAEALLRESGGLRGLSRLGVAALATRSGIGLSKATRLVAALELGRRSIQHPLEHCVRLGSSRDVDRAFRPRLSHAEVEHLPGSQTQYGGEPDRRCHPARKSLDKPGLVHTG